MNRRTDFTAAADVEASGAGCDVAPINPVDDRLPPEAPMMMPVQEITRASAPWAGRLRALFASSDGRRLT